MFVGEYDNVYKRTLFHLFCHLASTFVESGLGNLLYLVSRLGYGVYKCLVFHFGRQRYYRRFLFELHVYLGYALYALQRFGYVVYAMHTHHTFDF